MQGKLDLITEKARQDKRLKFTSLIHHVNVENLVQCYWELKKDKASGIDGVTVEAYGEALLENVTRLVERLKSKEYRPQPVRRVYIPKPGKAEKRGLGIPTVEDKLVQVMLKKLLQAIYEPDFEGFSHGFRPNRSCHTAVKELNRAVMYKATNYIVEVDIRKFFDTVSHYWLLRCLEERIADANLLWLIRRTLKAGIMEGNEYQPSDTGTPQGGVVSPLLANIYLHYVLDIWFKRVFQPKAQGYTQMIRYCDDFVVCCEHEDDAKRFLGELKERFAKFELTVAEEKTRIVKFGRKSWEEWKRTGQKPETFNFLGFTHYCGTTMAGKFSMKHKTSKENLRRKLKETKEWLKSTCRVETVRNWWPVLKAKLMGHYQYFGISSNYRCLMQYYCETKGMVYKWLNRRSQRKSITWEMFARYLERTRVPKPKIYHNLYAPMPK